MPEPGRTIPDPGFAGDRGEADPTLAAAIAAYAVDPGDPARHLDVALALRRARLLVPVVALPGASSGVEMATVLLTGQDGRQALLAFSGTTSLAAWRADARPVPVTAVNAARSAFSEGAAALLLDVAGPAPYAVEGPALEGLARGWSLVRTEQGPAWVESAGPE